MSRAYCLLSSLLQSFLIEGMASNRMNMRARSMECNG
jgi:hypothetical protein